MKNKSKASDILNNLPFMFEKNIGQYDNKVQFILRQSGCTIFFTQSEVLLNLITVIDEENLPKSTELHKVSSSKKYDINTLRIIQEKSNQVPEIIGIDKFDCNLNYFKGSNKSDWITDVPIYQKVVYKEIYPGIDLVYYGNNGKLEHDFIVRPEGDIRNIKMTFDGCDKIEMDEEKSLVIKSKKNIVKMPKPIVYQEIEKEQVEIMSDFVIEDEKKVGFNISTYDKKETLVIDPQLLYGTYLGGNGTDEGFGICVDENENAYITGRMIPICPTTEFPITSCAYQLTPDECNINTFLIKIDTKACGSASLKYGSYICGNGTNEGYGVCVDNNENAYITGFTNSTTGFPITPNAYQSIYQGSTDAFLIKINTQACGLESLVYGTYLGGNGIDSGYGISVDKNENAYITGITTSTSEFPITSNAYQKNNQGSTDAFLIKIDTKTGDLKYGTYLGGDCGDIGRGIAVDKNENAYITGWTCSTLNFPITSNAYQSIHQEYEDAFLIKIDTKFGDLKYATYLGGNMSEHGESVAVDKNENAYIAGQTCSTSDFPITSSAYQYTYQGGDSDAFLIKIDTKLGKLLYGTYLGGSNDDYGRGVAVDENENAYITGLTNSTTDFPITSDAYQGIYQGGDLDAFLIKIDTRVNDIASLIYGTYLGGNELDTGLGLVLDKNGKIYVTGATQSSAGFPITSSAYQHIYRGNTDSFLIKLYTKVCNLILEKSTCKCRACVRDKIPYTIKLKNEGPGIAYNIKVTDIITSGAYVTSIISSSGYMSESKGSVIWNIPELKVGDSVIAMLVVIATNKVCFSNDGNLINKCEVTSFEGIALKNMSDTVITHIDCCCNSKK